MKNTLSNFWNNLSSKATNNRVFNTDIEVISDELAHQVRGGDKDYIPMYELDKTQSAKFFLPSILLEP